MKAGLRTVLKPFALLSVRSPSDSMATGNYSVRKSVHTVSFLWVDLQCGLMTQFVQVQEGMFHVEHQQRKGVSEKYKVEKEKIVVEI